MVVRNSPAGRLLLVDGSHASLMRSGRVFTNSTWDLLAATVLLLPLGAAGAKGRRGSAPRVLLLGLGGGSVLRVIRALVPHAELEAVELSSEVVRVARREFGLGALGARVHIGDAAHFVADPAQRGRFDVVIDDVYAGPVGAMFKPDGWRSVLRGALACLRSPGLLVVNTLNARDERLVDGLIRWPHARVRHAQYHNRILVLPKGQPLSARSIRPLWRCHEELSGVLRHTRVMGVRR